MNRLINPHHPDPHAPYSRRAVDPLDFNDDPDEEPADGDFFDWVDDDDDHVRPDTDDADTRQSDDEDED